MNRQSKASGSYNPNFNRSVGQNAFQFNQSQMEMQNAPDDQLRRGSNEMTISDNSHIAVEPMFGNEYGMNNGAPRGHPPQEQRAPVLGSDPGFADAYRVKTTTSS